MRAREVFLPVLERLQAKTRRCFDATVHYPHKVELRGWTREEMGDQDFEIRLSAAKRWADQPERGMFNVHAMMLDRRLIGRVFEFEHESDAAMFKLRWA